MEGSLLLNKRANDKIRDIVLTRAKQVLGNRVDEAKRVIESVDVTKGDVDRTEDIPYLAGSSNDGKTVYIDRRLPREIKVAGKSVDPAKYLRVHEEVERALMVDMKIPYQKAHEIAEAYEKSVVEADGMNWMAYEKVLDGYIDETEHERVELAPADLYLKPYPKVLANRIKRHSQIIRHGA